MLHSSVCISSAPTSWLVVRHARTHARMQRTADGLITDCRKLQIHEPKESVLAKSGCAAERSCSLRCEYRRIIDSRVTVTVSQTLPQKPWSLKKKNKTWFLVYQTDFGDDKLSGNERRITRTWFIHFENVFVPKSACPQFPPLLRTFIVRPSWCTFAEHSYSRERQTFSPKWKLNFPTLCP